MQDKIECDWFKPSKHEVIHLRFWRYFLSNTVVLRLFLFFQHSDPGCSLRFVLVRFVLMKNICTLLSTSESANFNAREKKSKNFPMINSTRQTNLKKHLTAKWPRDVVTIKPDVHNLLFKVSTSEKPYIIYSSKSYKILYVDEKILYVEEMLNN